MVRTKWFPLFGLALLLLVEPIVSSKILGYFITPSRSHFIIHDSLMRGLAAKGHNVTVVSFYPPPAKPIPNYTSIQLDMDSETEVVWKEMTSGMLQQAANQENFFKRMPHMMRIVKKINTDTYKHPLVEKLQREETFDVVVLGWFFNDYQIGIASQFKCPAVISASMNAFKPLRDYVGNPSGASFSPMGMANFPSQMSYLQRVANFGFSMIEQIVVILADYFVFEPAYTQNFPPDKHPSYADAKKNVSLVLVTSHFSQGYPMLSFPAMVEVSGMHIKRKPDPLPTNIKDWLDTAKNGVIYFSLGSNIKSTEMSADKLSAIMNVFGRLKQRVLWKFENDNLPGKPDNVMIQNWLPQDDVLAHPNVILFISHCGKGGVNEARYHGVPILGIPVFADQPKNIAEIEAEGWAVSLQYSDLTEATFEAALAKALGNPKYAEVVQKHALMFRDRPQHPLDTAIYWVEYVIRHNGAKHMQSPAVHLTWYQYYSLDVIALYVAVIWAVLKVSKFVIIRLWRIVFGRSSKTKRD